MINSNLGIGPMSSETIEAVFRHSSYHRKELMLIASKNQVDYCGGYVNKWKTADLAGFVGNLKKKYPQSMVRLCRDHCGPGFNNNHDLQDVYKTINDDVDNGFDLIHIDFCHFKGSREEKLEESKKAIVGCLKINPKILLEIGTDENVGSHYSLSSLPEMEREISFFNDFCRPEFYVVQTGSLVKEICQVGSFNKQFVEAVRNLIGKFNLKIKEHNADYLDKKAIEMRRGLVDALNIAPQLGAVQTKFVLGKCLVYGVDFNDFANEVYGGGKWKKWLYNNTPENKFLCSVIAGHYHFTSDAYKKIISRLEEHEDIKESIINRLSEVIDHYESALQLS